MERSKQKAPTMADWQRELRILVETLGPDHPRVRKTRELFDEWLRAEVKKLQNPEQQ